ncbi:MAG: hypothetical protein EBY29_15180, partial [Planctomycetes bacterium]|nr:hypothetical protein [Planctomycetota bacterium]
MDSLALIFIVVHASGSYTLAGALAAVGSVVVAIAMPLWSRTADRVGQGMFGARAESIGDLPSAPSFIRINGWIVICPLFLPDAILLLMRLSFISCTIALAAICSLHGCHDVPKAASTPAPAQAKMPTEDSQALLNGMVFDQVWVIIRDTHPDPSINQGQWNDMRLEYRDRAVAATDAETFRTVLRDMLQTLGESHFAIIP